MGPYHLVLDVGNSRTKAALFRSGRSVRSGTLANGDLLALQAWLAGSVPAASVVGSVAAPDGALLEWLRSMAVLVEVNGTTPSPLRSAYGSPLTLGADRLANAVGGALLFPARPVLVIDLGTCITCDLVGPDGTYLGGTISPGMHMRARAMHEHSARLPLVVPEEDPAIPGIDTRGSLAAGVHHGILGELRWSIELLGYQRPGMAVVMTGGDAPRYARGLKSGIFAHPFLTLIGLHAILVHHLAVHPAGADARARDAAGPGTAG